MNHLIIPGCWYCDTVPNESNYVASQLNIPVTKTKFGDIAGNQLLWTVISPNGIKFSGVGQFDDKAHEYNGSQWNDLGAAQGSHPIIYKDNNRPEIISNVVGAPTGSQGYRYVDDDGNLISSDDTIAPGSRLAIQYNITNLWQFTVRGNGKYVVGELQDGVGARINGKLVRINSLIPNIPKEQNARDVHFKIADGKVSISWYFFLSVTNVTSCFLWMSLEEFDSLVNDEPGPPPSNGEQSEPMIKSFDRPFWMAPYFSHHVRYGDVPLDQHMGNAIAVLGDERDPNIRNLELDRITPLGKPMIVDIGTSQPNNEYLNQTIAWLASGRDILELKANVNRALAYEEKPVIAYLDSTDWPESNPFESNRVWPSIQAYRFPSESLRGFERRIGDAIRRCTSYGLPLVLVPRADDFNGQQDIKNIVECFSLYEQWMREFFFVGFMPFADLRKKVENSIFGFRNYPELLSRVKAFFYAIPSERPNRFDYWQPSASSVKDVLKNKLGQQRAAVVMEDYLRKDILSKYEGSNNPPPIEPPPNIPPNIVPKYNWTTNDWKNWWDRLRQEMNVMPTIVESELVRTREALNKNGADWQFGSLGNLRPRIHCPVEGFPLPFNTQPFPPNESFSKPIDVGDFGGPWVWVPRW